MYDAALVSGIRKDFRNGLKHAKRLITYDQTYTSKPELFQPCKEKRQLSQSSFTPSAALRISRQHPADANGNNDGNIPELAAQAAFEINAIHVNIGIVPVNQTDTPGFDMLISFFIQVTDGCVRFLCSL